MKVGLNATCFNNRPSGARQQFVGIYGKLIEQLPDVHFSVYESSDYHVGKWFKELPNVSTVQTPIPSKGPVRKFLAGRAYWPSALKHTNFDIFERFNLPIVNTPYGQTLLTVHDIRRVQLIKNSFKRKVYKTYIEKSLRAADRVIAVSQVMKNEIHDFFPEIPISVIYNGVDTDAFNSVAESDMHTFRNKHGIPKEFLLAVGHFEKRKNYLRLIDAITILRDRGSACPLVIIGNDNGERRAIEERIASANLSSSITILSGLSNQEVRCAYKLCTLFVFPSVYEGFGIPILEAMAGERPMVLSDIPVFREITQDKSAYFPYSHTDQMAYSIEHCLTSSDECARLVNYGKDRVNDFSFQRLAIQLEGMYRELM